MQKQKVISIIVALGMLILIGAGCAVMTVDVDVYKGPLANTEQTQGEQAISLSMGAKPLLVQLRDQLEVSEAPLPAQTKAENGPNNLGHYSSDLEHRLADFRSNSWYKADYIPVSPYPTNTSYSHAFNNEFAVSVNEILSLYDDQVPSAFVDSITRIQQLVDQYGKDLATLRPTEMSQTTNLWSKIYGSITNNPSSTNNTSKQLITAYENFFYRNGPTNFQKGIFITNLAGTNIINPPSANAQFQLLIDSRAEADAETLFGSTNSSEKQDFISYVRDVSQAFIDARSTLDQLLKSTIQLQLQLQNNPTLDPALHDKMKMATADLTSQLINVRSFADGLTNNFSTNPTNSLYLWPSNSIMLALQAKLIRYNIDVTNMPATNYSNLQWEKITTSFQQLLEQDNGTICEELSNLNDRLENDGDAADRFGLTKGPTASGQELLTQELTQAADEVKSTAGNSLDSGRPVKGLQSLIEDYLKQNIEYRTTDAWPTDDAFQDLLDGLTEFAEKVVTLGNSASLLDGNQEAEVNNYVTVLQSVGNSLTVQIDELKAQAGHQNDLNKRDKLVGDAISRSGGFTNADLNNWPPAGGVGVTYDAKDAAQQLETILQMEYLKVLHAQAISPDTNGNSTGSKPKTGVLANETNIVLVLSMTADGMVTNAEIKSPSFAQTPVDQGSATSGGTNVVLQVNGLMPAAQVEEIGQKQSVSKKVESGTNVVLKLYVSSDGVLTNADVAISSVTTSTDPDSTNSNSPISGLTFQAALTLSSNALITGVTITNSSTNVLTGLPPIQISLQVNGRMNTNYLVASSTNSTTDKWLAVLEQATEFRAGMIYLRPASSYLRSSYAASTLQSDEGNVWKNMLQEQLFHGIPLIGGLNTDPKTETLSEIDKDSWQNINSVRVAGIFKVNYVIAKDDIGNWYVKSFSSDPTNVFNSMAGLAKYATGGSLSALSKGSVVNASSSSVATAAGSTASAPSSSTNVLAAAFTLIASNYLQETIGTFTNLTTAANSLHSQVIGGWPSLIDTNDSPYTNVLYTTEAAAYLTLSNVIVSASSTMNNILLLETNETDGAYYMSVASAYDQQTANILSGVEDYDKAFALKIDGQYSWPSRGTVITNTATTVNGLLTDYINQRQTTMNQCESGLNLISQMSGAK
jgi:hypothetical protein